MERLYEFLQKAHVFYVATIEGDQPRVRPFGIAHIIDGKLCVMRSSFETFKVFQ